ncbi:uncharacterized protein LOC121983331 isoform X1 [Zingiber officinale]|uniref:Uncharacterized protein n=1 Tax=Zingiber officinale TaxID=94328 RepID=A0A8J5LCS5_ZINOF|nr:uncharacterized protein LOC121983331 isoform X1 [Zingiber officinale]KAG6508836.1 hypothetical protein ZIOFF_034218 [Zingiber officinale]
MYLSTFLSKINKFDPSVFLQLPLQLHRQLARRSSNAMHRQSLGSPGPKLLVSGMDDQRKSLGGHPHEPSMEAVEDKAIRTSSRAERSIHLIPICTILCILVLYLLSHDPQSSLIQDSDLKAINGWGLRSDPAVVAEKGVTRSATQQSRRRRLKAARKMGVARDDWAEPELLVLEN